MSNVIKACFVKKTKNQDQFTKKTAHSLYQETKVMIEEFVNEAEEKAKAIINEAKKEAEILIKQSQIESETIKKQAYEEGLKNGYHEGITKAEEEITILAQETKVLAQNLGEIKGEYLYKNKEEIIKLIMLISQKIISIVIDFKPDLIGDIIGNVLKEVGDAEQITIKVNPRHLPYLDVFDQQFKDIKTSKITFAGDPEVAPGGCLVITENGFVDAQIDEQLLLLKKVLKEEANNVGF